MTSTGILLLVAPLLTACGAELKAPEPEQPAAPPPAAPEASADTPSPAPPMETSTGLGDPAEGGVRRQAFSIVEQGRTGDDPASAYQAARALLAEALATHPDDADLVAAMGHLWADEVAFRALTGEALQANQTQALAAYERALELVPGHVRATAGLASLLMERRTPEDDAKAEALYRRALEADPEDQHARLGLAEVLMRLEQLDEAEPLLEALLEEHRAAGRTISAIGVQEKLGRLFLARGETARAEAVLLESTQALEALDSERADYFGCPYQALGALYHQTGESAKELEALQRLADLEAHDPVAQRSVATLCASMGFQPCVEAYTARAEALEAQR